MKEGETDYIVRSHGNYNMKRSVNVDLELEAGAYLVLMKITAKRWIESPTVEEVIRDNCRQKQDKLIQIGLAYDLAHAKGHIRESEAEKKEREVREEKKRLAEKKQLRAKLREQKFRHWQLDIKQRARERRHQKRKEDRHHKSAEGGAPKEETGKSNIPDAEDTPPEVDHSGAATNGVAPATAGSDEVETKENGTAVLRQDAATLPSPAVPLSSTDPSQSAEAETEAQQGAPVEPEESSASAQPNSSSEGPAPKATGEKSHEKFEMGLHNLPSVLINGNSPSTHPAAPSTVAPPSIAVAPSTTGGLLPDDSDCESDASFVSSVDLDLDFLEGQEVVVPPVVAAETDDEDAEFATDPWNAVCVVGLRVYSKDPDSVVQVVRPTPDDEDDEPPRDVDDMSKGASKEPVGDEVKTESGA